jgi:hypothetical protein
MVPTFQALYYEKDKTVVEELIGDYSVNGKPLSEMGPVCFDSSSNVRFFIRQILANLCSSFV